MGNSNNKKKNVEKTWEDSGISENDKKEFTKLGINIDQIIELKKWHESGLDSETVNTYIKNGINYDLYIEMKKWYESGLDKKTVKRYRCAGISYNKYKSYIIFGYILSPSFITAAKLIKCI